MDDLILQPTQSSPAVNFSVESGRLSMSGESYPENAFEFYRPLIQWIDDYLVNRNRVLLELSLSYLNTSSIRCLLEIMDNLDAAYRGGKSVSIEWRYDAENERALDLAEEFEEDLVLPFKIIADNG